MNARRLLPIALALVSLAPAPASADDANSWSSLLADFFMGPEAKEAWDWKGAVAPGQAVEIKGINGSITAEPGERLEVHAIKRGRSQNPADVKIEVIEHAGGVTICPVYPSWDSRPNQCQPGSGGRMNVRNNNVTVEFTVKVPAGVRLVARTVNGSVAAAGLKAGAEAWTVNGSVRLETDGPARAETVNGSIRAWVGRADGTTPMEFKTVNGSVTLHLPAATNAALRVQTVNGSISNDLALQTTTTSRRKLVGTLGQGGALLAIETVNGSVAIASR